MLFPNLLVSQFSALDTATYLALFTTITAFTGAVIQIVLNISSLLFGHFCFVIYGHFGVALYTSVNNC